MSTAANASPSAKSHAETDAIAQTEGVDPADEMYDAKVKVLSEYVKHHVKEEENEMFPKVKAS